MGGVILKLFYEQYRVEQMDKCMILWRDIQRDMKEETYKYGMGKARKNPVEFKTELEVSVCTYDLKIIYVYINIYF